MELSDTVSAFKNDILGRKRVRWLFLTTLGAGVLSASFDIARKTVFDGASWNYDYQYWNFVYNPLAVFLLICLLLVLVVGVPWLLKLSSQKFSAVIYLFFVSLFVLSLVALPLKMTKALDVGSRGLFNAAVFFIEHGPLAFFDSYHSLPRSKPNHPDLYIWSFDTGQGNVVAEALASQLASLDWLPFHEPFAAYVRNIQVQRHGPVSVLLIVPFVFVFGKTTGAAVVGSLIWLAALPVVAYHTYRLHFSEQGSRLAALLAGIAPGTFIWLRHGSPVPYDAFTALLIGLSLYFFLRALDSATIRAFIVAGAVFSLAALTKLTAFSVVPAFAIIILYTSPRIIGGLRRLGAFLGGSIIVPMMTFLTGYNFFAQYVYTIYKLTLYKIQYAGGGGDRPADSPSAALNNDVIGLVGSLYNIRWMNIVLLLLALVLVCWIGYRHRDVISDTRNVISLALLIPFLPYAVWLLFSTGTLSRHTIILIVPLGFVSLSGLSLIRDRRTTGSGDWIVRYGQVSLAVSAVLYLVNI